LPSRLKQREQRASEQTHLLPGNDGARAGAQRGDVGERGGTGAEREALAFERIGQLQPVSALGKSAARASTRRPSGSAPYHARTGDAALSPIAR
jgi:hypothetical protein